MNLNSLNHFIDPVILDRGWDYVLGGHVLSIAEEGDLVYCAEVEGSELYEVYVELDEGAPLIHPIAIVLTITDRSASIKLLYCFSFGIMQQRCRNL